MPNSFKVKPKPNYEDEFKSVNEVIDHYLDNDNENVLQELRDIRSITLRDVILIYGKGKDIDGRHLDHFRKIRTNSLRQASKELIGIIELIRDCGNFQEVFELLNKKIKIFGIGEMYLYDISFYLSARLGFKPKHIYMHRGTREGAKYLGLDIRREFIPKEEFEKLEKGFKKINAYDIENLLCSYKTILKNFKKVRR